MAAVGFSEILVPIFTPKKTVIRGLVPASHMLARMAIIKVMAVTIIIKL